MQQRRDIFIAAVCAIFAVMTPDIGAAEGQRCEVVFTGAPSTASAAQFLARNADSTVETYIFRGGGITFFIHPSQDVTSPASARAKVLNIIPNVRRGLTQRLDRALAADDLHRVENLLYIKTEQDGFASAVRSDTALYAMFIRAAGDCGQIRAVGAFVRPMSRDRRAPGIAAKPPRPAYANPAAVRSAGAAALRTLKGAAR